MKVCVTGGSGFVGGHLVRVLLERGASVRCLVRNSGGPDALEGLPVERVVGDLRDRERVCEAVRGCTQVFHCAADYRLWVPDAGAMLRSNVDGTRHVLEAAAAAGVERVVHTSSVGALGLASHGAAADECEPVRLGQMIGPYKRSKFLAERVAEEWAARGLNVVIVNPSTPVGERDVKPTPTGQMIVDFLAGRMIAYAETGLNLIDVRDVALGHVLAAERGRSGEKYILGNRNMTLKEILDTLARITGLPAPRVKLPHWVPLAVSAVDSSFARLTRRPPRIPVDAVRMARYKMFFDSSKAVRELGLPQTPVEQALERAVSWFRAEREPKPAARRAVVP
ncbi:MAG TPA: hopanoid-associated sugar epimerase [Candidatus Polarisedimenticolaceae bacterium]|nr:hopanoid-associated sugar epimerase [Candidatus Polarisedimenticolaceae bacterium]